MQKPAPAVPIPEPTAEHHPGRLSRETNVRAFDFGAWEPPIDEPYEHALMAAVDLAFPIIWDGRLNFVHFEKPALGNGGSEFYSSIDKLAQAAIVEFLERRLYPVDFLCEEEGGPVPQGAELLVTVDGMDGSEKFRHGNLLEVSVTLSVMKGQEVIAACVGAVATREKCSFGPTSAGVAHTSGRVRRLLQSSPRHDRPLEETRIILRRPASMHLPVTQRLVAQTKCHENTSQSLGVFVPRLCKREFPIAVLWHGSTETGWDMAPLVGILKMLGYVFLRTTEDGEWFELYEPDIPRIPRIRGYDTVIIHHNDLSLLEPFMRS